MVEPEAYIDVNVFVYWLGKHPLFGEKAYEWIKRIEDSSRGKYVTSTLTLYQVIVMMAGLTGKTLRDMELIEEIVNSIESLPSLIITPLTIEDMEQAVELMRKYGLDYEDAIHLATALRNRVREIVSSDKDFDKTPLKRRFN